MFLFLKKIENFSYIYRKLLYSCISLFLALFFISSCAYADSLGRGGATDSSYNNLLSTGQAIEKIEKMRSRLSKISRQLMEIRDLISQSRLLTERYETQAQAFSLVVDSYLELTGSCMAMETKFELQNAYERPSNRTLQLQSVELENCFKDFKKNMFEYREAEVYLENMLTAVTQLEYEAMVKKIDAERLETERRLKQKLIEFWQSTIRTETDNQSGLMEIIRKTQLCGRHLGSSTESDIKQAMQSSGGDIMSDCIILSKHLETIARNNYFRSFDRGRALWLGQKKINDLRKQAEDDDTSVRALQNGLNRAFLSNIEKLKLINRLTLTGVPNKDEKIFFFGIETEGDKLTIFEGIRKRDRFAELRIKNFTYDSNFPVSIDKDISFRIGSEYIKPADLNLNHIIRAGEQLDIYLKEQKVIIPAPEKPRFHSKKDYLIALKAVAHEVKASLSYRHNAIAPYFKEQINSR